MEYKEGMQVYTEMHMVIIYRPKTIDTDIYRQD